MVPLPEPIRQGFKTFNDGESWKKYLVFPKLTHNEANLAVYTYGMEGRHSHREGQMYANRSIIRHCKKITIITQSGGWDI